MQSLSSMNKINHSNFANLNQVSKQENYMPKCYTSILEFKSRRDNQYLLKNFSDYSYESSNSNLMIVSDDGVNSKYTEDYLSYKCIGTLENHHLNCFVQLGDLADPFTNYYRNLSSLGELKFFKGSVIVSIVHYNT